MTGSPTTEIPTGEPDTVDQALVPPAAEDLARRFLATHPSDAARVLERFGGSLAAELVAGLPVDRLLPLIEALADDVAADCVAGLPDAAAARLLVELDLDEAAALMRRMNEPDHRRLLQALPKDNADQLGRILAFPAGTAGALMDPKVLSVPESLTSGQALEHVRAAPHLTLYYLYLVDSSSHLSGVANLRELMLAEPEQPLAEVAIRSVERLAASADHLAILAHPGWTEFHALPVVDAEGHFVGALRYETLRRLEGQSHTGDTTSLAVSLGELYWLGLSGILEGLGHIVAGRSRSEGGGPDRGGGSDKGGGPRV